MNYTASEVKSGILLFLSFIILLGMTFVIGGMTGRSSVEWHIRFGYVSGLEKGAPVHYAGRQVGKVEKIAIDASEKPPVLVTVKTTDEVLLREDSKAFIDMLGLMGEKFIELTPGTDGKRKLEAGEHITGKDPIPFYELMDKMEILSDNMVEMSESLTPTIKAVGDLIINNMDHIEGTIENIDNLSVGLATFVGDNGESLGQMIGNMNTTLVYVERFAKNADRLLVDHREDIAKTISNLHMTSGNVRDMTNDLKYRPWRLLRRDS